jgi:3',5'-cyclic AMP phosphodiesterase CpdA
MKNKKLILISLLLATSSHFLCFSQNTPNVSGYVFDDSNQNGIFDAKEKGVAGVLVSNQREVVKTNKKGLYLLPVTSDAIIFITKPSGYNVPVNELNLPQFYYIHQPEGSPKGLVYKGIAPSGNLPAQINFPLIKSKAEKEFKVFIVGDLHIGSKKLEYFKNDIVQNMLKYKADFYMALGDVVSNDCSMFDPINKVTQHLGIPVYNVLGNHDVNYHASERKYEAESFKSHFGPDYFSFNYGKVHFVVLNNIKYYGWNKESNSRGSHEFGLGEKQLKWLVNDLQYVPEDNLVVFSEHIPFSQVNEKKNKHSINKDEMRVLFDVLKTRKHLLSLAGHHHTFQMHELANELSSFLFEGEQVLSPDLFPEIVVGAGCGSWWSYPKDERGIPWSVSNDGTPNGFSVFSFSGNEYDFDYYPANQPEDFQMRISRPLDIVDKDSLQKEKIIVNVFTGDSDTKVRCTINDDIEVTLEQTPMIDPFTADIFNQYREYVVSWAKVARAQHIWSATLPEGLLPGAYKLKVDVTLRPGKEYTSYKLIEIK